MYFTTEQKLSFVLLLKIALMYLKRSKNTSAESVFTGIKIIKKILAKMLIDKLTSIWYNKNGD